MFSTYKSPTCLSSVNISTSTVHFKDRHTIQDRHQRPWSISWLKMCGSLVQKSHYIDEKNESSRIDILTGGLFHFHKVELNEFEFSMEQISFYKQLIEI